ncbi:MAG: hypothetical protein CSA68_00510 [Rhodobacterales bacterium]|nr:MAG: hypothetical protein CSA68_00510 [Rhodobacterales bacterium]
MVEIAEIKDVGSLGKWLKGQSGEVSIWIARRAALRVLPVYWCWVAESKAAQERNLTALPVLRFDLISEIARATPTFDTKVTARAARAAVDATGAAGAALAALAAADAALAAVRTVRAVGTVRVAIAAHAALAAAGAARANPAAFWWAVRKDCLAVGGADAAGIARLLLDALPLWHGAENPILSEWSALNTALGQPSQKLDWSFWIAWYDSVLEGKPLNADMLAEIARIKDEDWDKGEAIVLSRINEIWRRYQL